MPIADLPPELLALELRRRAQAMRVFGHSLARAPASTLALRAGPEVWADPARSTVAMSLAPSAKRIVVSCDVGDRRWCRATVRASLLTGWVPG